MQRCVARSSIASVTFKCVGWSAVMPAVVIGGGTMGAGIAQVLLEAQVEVFVSEANDELASSARRRIVAGLRRMALRRGGREADADQAIRRLRVVTGIPDVGAGLIIEALPEDLVLKQHVLRRVQLANPDSVLATNTSSLSINALAEALPSPAALVGMHFFNPVPTSSLIEVIVGRETSPDHVKTAHAWAKRLGKDSIEVRDAPGFASSRLGLAIGLEAMRMLESDVASAADIDARWSWGTNFR